MPELLTGMDKPKTLYAIIPTYPITGNLQRREMELFDSLDEVLATLTEYQSWSTKSHGQKYRLFRLEEITPQ